MLGFTRRQGPARDLGFGLFGKMPAVADFLSVGPPMEAVSHLTSWMERGISWTAEYRADLMAALGPNDARAFVFSTNADKPDGKVAVGLLGPSRDAVGRLFPLSIYASCQLGDDVEQFPMLALAAGDFLERAMDVLTGAASGRDPRPDVAGFQQGPSANLSSACDEFQQWAGQTRPSTVWQAVFGPDSSDLPERALVMLLEVVRPLRNQEQPRTSLGLRFPLGTGGVGAAVFWMEVVRRAMGWKRTVPCAFWHAHPDSGQLVLALGEPPPRWLAELYRPDQNSESLCDVAESSIKGELTPALRAAIQADESVAALLAAL